MRKKNTNLWLSGYRKMSGLTQIQMAKKIGITPVSYSYKETGRRLWSSEEMFRIMDVLNKERPELTLDMVFRNKVV